MNNNTINHNVLCHSYSNCNYYKNYVTNTISIRCFSNNSNYNISISNSIHDELETLASNGDYNSIVEIARQLIDGEKKIMNNNDNNIINKTTTITTTTTTTNNNNNTTTTNNNKFTTIEEETARLWLEIAAIDHNHAEAQFLLSVLLDEMNNKSIQSNTSEEVLNEIKQARKAAMQNKKRNKNKNKNNSNNDDELVKVEHAITSLSLLKKAANQGHGKAMCYLGNKLLEKGDKDNVIEAMNWYKLAASSVPPVTDALYNLGTLYYEGRSSIFEADPILSLNYFTSAAKAGDLAASFWCGYCYMNGIGVDGIDPNKAIKYLSKAAVEGNGTAHYHLATIYRSGLSNDSSKEKDCNHKMHLTIHPNKELFDYHVKKALELEDPDAMFCMADIYFNGLEGFTKDIDKAKEFYEKASALEHVEATVALGALHYNGLGGYKKDSFKAFELYNKAAEKGSLEAWRNLASMYYLGDGIEKNEDMAKQIMVNVFGKEI